MRNLLFGMAAGLIIGALLVFAYGGGSRTLEFAQVPTDPAAMAHPVQDDAALKKKIDALSLQLQAALAERNQLKQQQNDQSARAEGELADHQQAAIDQEMTRLTARLKLTPEQANAVRAAMEAIVHGVPGARPVNDVLEGILNPRQKIAWQELKDESSKATAENLATSEMNRGAEMFPLSEEQKDKVFAALYQVEFDDQKAVHTGDPAAYFDARAKAQEDAWAQVLTPDQLALYHQQAQQRLEAMEKMLQASAAAAAQFRTGPSLSGSVGP